MGLRPRPVFVNRSMEPGPLPVAELGHEVGHVQAPLPPEGRFPWYDLLSRAPQIPQGQPNLSPGAKAILGQMSRGG